MPNLFPTWPAFTIEEADAVRDVIISNKVNYWTGQIGRNFEKDFAAWAGTHHAIALSNGTLALDLALNGLKIGARNGGSKSDQVIVTPRTFIASISTVVTAGATPVFADVDYDSGNISPETIAPKINNHTKAIIPVHLGGWPADMDGIMALASSNGLSVIEDCAQAHGAKVGSRSVGSMGHVSAWSFCQDKIMTTGGEGGMLTTNDEEMWNRMWSYKDHGKDWDAVYNRDHPPGFRFVHESFGTNWRMLEMQAAIGRIQLTRMGKWTARRTKTALAIAKVLQQFPDTIRVPSPDAGMTHAYYRLYGYFREDGLKDGWDRDRVVAELIKLGVPCMHGTCSEVYKEKAFDNTGWRPATPLPIARELGETSIMFLTHPTLLDEHVDKIAAVTNQVMSAASK